jgi:predicted membrane protein
MQQLTRGQQDTCTYTGIFGAMLGATCLIQLFAITREHWISGVMILAVIFSIISYILLSLQKSFAPILLLVAGLLVFALNFFMILFGVFSLVILVYLIYSVAVIVVLFAGQYPQKLRLIALEKKKEEAEWRGRI